MKVFIASDHAGFLMKQKVALYLRQLKFGVTDLGPFDEERTDYPDYADKVIFEMEKDLSHSVGILLCGSGQGMAMRANKFPFIRAALCWNQESAQLSRQHNDANVLCLGARLLEESTLLSITETFLTTSFEGGRHALRVQKISQVSEHFWDSSRLKK